MSDVPDFGNKTPRGIDLDRLRHARSLTPEERLERNRRAAESVILLRVAGRRMREQSREAVRASGSDEPPNDPKP
jgi:hypothetical protein